MIPAHLPGNQKPTTDRQTRAGRACLTQVLSPLPLLKSQHWLCSTPAPTPYPPIAAFVGPSPLPGAAPRQLHFALPSLWFVPGNSVPSSLLESPTSHPCIFYHLLEPSSSSLGPADPRASGEAASRASSLLPARALSAQGCGTHTAAPLSLRSGAER